jgi:large subunit ribosomal protein L19
MSGKHPLVQAVENAQLKQDIPAFAPYSYRSG